MKDAQPAPIFLQDYQPPAYFVDTTDLDFELYEDHALVTAQLQIRQNPAQISQPLVLHGQDLELLSLAIDDQPLSAADYSVSDELLTIANPPEQFRLTCVTRIQPQNNKSLEGLYKSRTMFCTQCEAEGFRKITYYPDRPDVMAEFTTRVSADKSRYPVLLSNGNCVERGDGEDGRHWVKWHDPFPKPSYLFALVAGDLHPVNDTFTTASGRQVKLQIFVEEKDLDKCDHAMTSLKNAMKWDEDVYGREYDLDIFMIVAVDDFNMGAMENKGLNVFNTSCVLAKRETTTDDSFQAVEAVVAHEYFHNWSGNRVTCRDWFQLSLKEGFTVFRDSEFSADMGSRTVKRVEDVNLLRTFQFAEDAGPMAHPVQPSSFIEISNFYTLTVYEKGAEVVRMIHSLLGPDLFRKGSDLYFERHDGQAVTIDDFVAAMAEVSGRDFSQFMNWYRQAGTPKVTVTGDYDADAKVFHLSVKQTCPPTPEAQIKAPFHIPMAMGLLGASGSLPLKLQGEPEATGSHRVLEITAAEETFTFVDVKEPPVPSLFRNFSAPVKLQYNYTSADLCRIVATDEDGFCRWDAAQKLAVNVIFDVKSRLGNEPAPSVDPVLLESHQALLEQARDTVAGNASDDLKMLARTLTLPSEEYLAEEQAIVDVEGTHHARNRVKRKLAQVHYDLYLDVYLQLNKPKTFAVDAASIAERSLKNTLLNYLVTTGKPEAIELAHQQYLNADNMTDELAALTDIVHSASRAAEPLKAQCLSRFYDRWQNESLVMNRWFSVQASVPHADTLERVKALMQHTGYDADNPNKIRSLVGVFCGRNAICFHDRSGAGYQFLADRVLELNSRNPQIASRILTPLTRWRKYDENRQQLMVKALETIKADPDLSKDVYEVVTKSLATKSASGD